MQKERDMPKLVMNKQLLILLLIGGLYSLGMFLSSTFVNVYLWKHSGEYMTIALYNLGIFVFQPITFILAGNLAKKLDRIIVLRIGVAFLSLFFLIVLLIGEKAATLHFMIGALLGIGYGFYWLSFNLLTFEITEPETRDFFNGFFGVLQSFGGMIGPLIAGFIISKMTGYQGYTAIFTLSFILFICAIITSFFLNRRKADGQFQIKKVIKERFVNHNWSRVLQAHLFQGLREGVFLFIITILVFVTTNSEFALGIYNLILSGCSLVIYLLITKFLKPNMRLKAILFGALLIYGSIYLILFKQTYFLLIIYAIIVGIMFPVFNVPYASMTYDVIGRSRGAEELRVEYIVVRELFLNTGRVISILVFLIALKLYGSEEAVPGLLALLGTGHLFVYFYMKGVRLN